MVHRNAPLTPTGRLRLARCVVDQGWTERRAAERFQVSVTTTRRWVGRYRELGEAGMVDRSSRPHVSPRRLPTRRERRIIKVRVRRRWGPARIGFLLGIAPSTVHKVLTRFGLARLSHLDRATGRVVRRYEHDHPGDLVHVEHQEAGQHPRRRRPQGPRPRPGHATARPAPATRSCTTPSTTTPGWPTPRSSTLWASAERTVPGCGCRARERCPAGDR